jgi:hypothetical protein
MNNITTMSQSEPPAAQPSLLPRRFHVGRNSRGHWVVQDQRGLCGGLFIDRSEAVKFAKFENGNQPQAVIMVPGILELDMSATPYGQAIDTHITMRRAA